MHNAVTLSVGRSGCPNHQMRIRLPNQNEEIRRKQQGRLLIWLRGGVEQALRITWKSSIPFLHMQKVYGDLTSKYPSLPGNQVLVASKLLGYQCLECFCSWGRTSLHCRKVRQIPGCEWAHLPCRENYKLPTAAVNQSACFSFSVANHSRKLHKKHLIRAVAHRIGQFHWALHHQLAECTARSLFTSDEKLGRAWERGYQADSGGKHSLVPRPRPAFHRY